MIVAAHRLHAPARPTDHAAPAHRPGVDALFAAPSATLSGSGSVVALHARLGTDPAAIGARLGAAFDTARSAGVGRPVVVGALPFRLDGTAHLQVPARLTRGPALRPRPAGVPRAVFAAPPTVTDRPSPAAYRAAVAAAVDRLTAGELDKVVLARSLDLSSPDPIDAQALLTNLAAANPHGYTFSVPVGAGAALIGASPELLVSRRGTEVTAHPMAGSAPRAADPAENARRARALLASGKDRHEHAVVVDAVRAGLAPLCAELTVPAAPSVTATPTMLHLSTRIHGVLADRSTTALDLGLALHPTPAVGGAPADAARLLIDRLEPFDRGLYAGMVGWTDDRGDGDWVVTIRCGVVADRTVRLFAGAGIMADSDPEAELAETTAKLGTLLRALGL